MAYMRISLFTIAIVTALLHPSQAEAIEPSVAREVKTKHESTMVTVRITLTERIVFVGEDSEYAEYVEESPGCIIRPDGCTLVPLSSTDPGRINDAIFGDLEDMQVKSELKAISVLFPDGAEVPMKLALRDQDLDIAFLLPLKPLDKPALHLSLDDLATVDVFDEVISLGRGGMIEGRTCTGYIDRIAWLIDKPRRMYGAVGEPGSIVFTAEGRPVGIHVYRFQTVNTPASNAWFSSGEDNYTVVLLPLGAALQAMEQLESLKPESPADAE